MGIDIIPPKTCSLDCIYCQLGPSSKKTTQVKSYPSSSQILLQIKKALSLHQRIDYITFSGSGEPTLNADIGILINEIKKTTLVPIAVLTNSTLLSQRSVRQSLFEADLVVPSLDAATEEVFLKINRPHPSLSFEDVIDGLKKFRSEFKGFLWLEIMLVKNVNDPSSHIKKLKEVIADIRPDRIQLNTVIRPPAEKSVQALSLDELEKIKKILNGRCEIIAEFDKKEQHTSTENMEDSILSMIQRRPLTLFDITISLGIPKKEINKHLDSLVKKKKIQCVVHKNSKYYEPA